MWRFFFFVLVCVALLFASLRSLRPLRLLFASGVDVAFALLAVRFCRSLRYTSTLFTLRLLLPPLLLLPLLLRPSLTLARTYLPLVYPASVAAYLLCPCCFFIFLFSPPSPTLQPWNFSQGCSVEGAWSARTRHGTLRRCRRVWWVVRLVAVVPHRVYLVLLVFRYLKIPLYLFFRVLVIYLI